MGFVRVKSEPDAHRRSVRASARRSCPWPGDRTRVFVQPDDDREILRSPFEQPVDRPHPMGGGRPSTHHQGAELAGTALEIGLAYEGLIFTEKHSFLRLGRRHVRVEYSVENRIT